MKHVAKFSLLAMGFLMIALSGCAIEIKGSKLGADLPWPGDCNLDGKVTAEEALDALEMYHRNIVVQDCVDTNKDGSVSNEELQAVIDAKAASGG